MRNISQAGTFAAVAAPKEPGGSPSNPMKLAGFGVQLAVTVVVFVLVGRWVDRRAGTEGIFTLLGGLLGFGGSMLSLLRQLKKTDGGESR